MRENILLDFDGLMTPFQVQEYLAQAMGFPEYYGKNLDALYDMLTDYTEDIGIEIKALTVNSPVENYVECIKIVMQEAQLENSHISLILTEVKKNRERQTEE